MNSIDYNIGILKRLIAGSVNGRPYVYLDDVEYVIENGGVIQENNTSDNNMFDRRPGTWPDYYDECDAKEYHEWFIKGTNIKLGFDYIDGETGEHEWYCIVCDGYDQIDPYNSEKELIEHFKWILMNENLTWRYYE